MKSMFRATQVAVLLSALFGAGCTPPADTEVALSGKVKEVVDRSKTTQATYAQYSWAEIMRKEGPVQEWGAEFHSGDKHRVETPRDRVVADCRAQTGIALSLDTGKIVEGASVARAACGVNTNKAFTAIAWKGLVQTPFGVADRVRLADKNDIRTYDISPDGVILRTTYAQNSPDAPIGLSSEATGVFSELPVPDIFDKASLARSYVPDRFKTAPKPAS
jgi:hypothetical protein